MALFQEILITSKQKLLPKWSPVFATMDDRVLVTMFQSFLANPDKVFRHVFTIGRIFNYLLTMQCSKWYQS
jgi:hypothetical protein